MDNSDISALVLPDQKFVPHNQRVNGTIADAIHAYESRGVPLRQLLSDYLAVITEPYQLQEALNPWRHMSV